MIFGNFSKATSFLVNHTKIFSRAKNPEVAMKLPSHQKKKSYEPSIVAEIKVDASVSLQCTDLSAQKNK